MKTTPCNSESIITLSPQLARRFILGRQGLWPGRRWRGMPGTESAMRALEYVQLDPLQIIARIQDLLLASRVIGYKPEAWQKLAYGQRKFFDWGGWLACMPMEELPYFRRLMAREKVHPDWRSFAKTHAAAIDEMRAVLRERGTVSNRDFDMKDRTRTQSYRGRKDSAVALYYLWRMGEVMTHNRVRFERVYALAETVAPAEHLAVAGEAETDDYILRKELAFFGLHALRALGTRWPLRRTPPAKEMAQIRERMLAEGAIVPVAVDGWRDPQFALAGDLPLLHDLAAGRVPKAWKPLDSTTDAECTFLSPLDVVFTRGRGKQVFDFEYTWEVYTPAPKRKYGYYTLPVLWGDKLVARFDSKLDRSTNTYHILGFWLEDAALAKDEAFAHALAAGFKRFVDFLGADKLNARGMKQAMLRKVIQGA